LFVVAFVEIFAVGRRVSGLADDKAVSSCLDDFDPDRNHYICPQNKILKHRTARMDSPIHIYRATAGDCKSCPIHQQCTRGTQRSLSVPFDESTRQEVMARQYTEAFQHSRRLRKKVEMLFAHRKQQFRFARLKLRGLAGAPEEFLLVATVQNLRRLVRLRPPAIAELPYLSTTRPKPPTRTLHNRSGSLRYSPSC
jgi:adenine-specific DNA glycosylase